MSHTPQDIQSVASDVQVLKTQVQSIANSVEALIGRQTSFEKSVSDSRQFKWPVALSAVGAVAVIVTALVQLVDLKTQNAELRNKVDTTSLLAPIAAKAEVSEKDRQELHGEAGRNAQEIARINVAMAGMIKDFAEIETQFRASDQVRNIQFASQQRLDAIMWEGIFKTRYPSDAVFYPHISK